MDDFVRVEEKGCYHVNYLMNYFSLSSFSNGNKLDNGNDHVAFS